MAMSWISEGWIPVQEKNHIESNSAVDSASHLVDKYSVPFS